ncbi:amidase [Aliiruegeria sabulilitoris]|uniref:amidase n=1 Tax=Aliiruegeria sabulilitoris TaxID=1510458 RepID=UPI00082CBF0C|nr:amidase family protein [Aliiruegeria sabulilitoris]NDR58588.1 amidase [Pseudoruegeria sp. M32A2M]
MDKWLTMTAADLGRGIGVGDVDPVALVDCYLDAIARHEFSPRIYARTTAERARAEAAAAGARARSGLRLSLLDGVPISWKDLFDTAGVATEAGSALLKGRVPEADAEVLRNATAAGLVCLGKTHMTELAFSGLGLNPITESPPCVNDLDAVSGGSSSGAATSVAFGLAAAGIGSDTGGSVRVPSAWNDLVGLKTTSGRLSLRGVVPLCARFDTVGPLCRSVEDATLLLAAMEGRKPADLKGASLSGKRLLVLETAALDDVREAPLLGFEQAVDRLAAAGAQIERRKLPVVAEALALSPKLFAPEAYGTWMEVIEAKPELMFAEVCARFRGGRNISGPEYVHAWQQLDRLRAQYLAETAGYDAVLVPSVPLLPPNKAALEADGEFFASENLLTLRNTRIGNVLGLCALTLPTAVPSAGLMVMAAPMSEERLLRLGTVMEPVLR